MIEHINTILKGVDQGKVPMRGGHGGDRVHGTEEEPDTWSVVLIDENAVVYVYFIQVVLHMY